MPEDRVTITADASQYFDVLSRAGVAADRLGSRGDRIGAGFLRGDRAVRVATQNITAGLLSATNATDAALIAMQSLERVFRIPIGATIGVAAGVAILQVLYTQIKKTQEADQSLREELGKSLDLRLEGSVESLAGSIDKLTQKMAALRKEMNSPTQKFIDLFDPNKLPQGLGGTAAGMKAGVVPGQQLSQPVKDLLDSEKQLVVLSSRRADKELKLAEAKRDQNKYAEIDIEYESKRADLFQGAYRSGLNMVDLMKRLIALQINRNALTAAQNELLEKGRRKLAESINDVVQSTLKGPSDLLADIGSGQFMKDFAQQQKREADIQRGQAIAAEIQDAIEKGIPLDPVLQAEGRALGLVGGSKGFSIRDLAGLDFSNMNELSKYDFNGLAPLSGMTLIVK